MMEGLIIAHKNNLIGYGLSLGVWVTEGRIVFSSQVAVAPVQLCILDKELSPVSQMRGLQTKTEQQ